MKNHCLIYCILFFSTVWSKNNLLTQEMKTNPAFDINKDFLVYSEKIPEHELDAKSKEMTNQKLLIQTRTNTCRKFLWKKSLIINYHKIKQKRPFT